MRRFILDETNRDVGDDKFFIVGGLIFTEEQMLETHRGIEKLRHRLGFSDDHHLKFQTRSKPPDMPVTTHTQAKKEVIGLLRDIGVVMLVTVGLNAIVNKHGDQHRMELALNTITMAYLQYLEKAGTVGDFLLDRDDSQIKHQRKLFQQNLLHRNPRDHILLFGNTSNGLSHLSSAVDIALGGFRYCVNQEAKADRVKNVAVSIFKPLSTMIWGVERTDGVKQIGGYGYLPRPQKVRHAEYNDLYKSLAAKLEELSSADAADVSDGF